MLVVKRNVFVGFVHLLLILINVHLQILRFLINFVQFNIQIIRRYAFFRQWVEIYSWASTSTHIVVWRMTFCSLNLSSSSVLILDVNSWSDAIVTYSIHLCIFMHKFFRNSQLRHHKWLVHKFLFTQVLIQKLRILCLTFFNTLFIINFTIHKAL